MLPKLAISNHVTERHKFIKFLRILPDKNRNWKEHIKYTENKVAKNLGLPYKARPFLDRNTLPALYCSYMQTYINEYIVQPGAVPTGQTLKKLTINKKMKYLLFLIKKICPHKGNS